MTPYVFATRIAVRPAKQVVSVTLSAADDGTNHVFAVGFGGQSAIGDASRTTDAM
ncbi:hypothetical protein OG585_51800 (plasmid) [Streptomyces sp. NBC_01340]|uniref:hypothetical protein n=1 Tax=unclassified Streptomyces TaxID=2593676 RepID=UPI00224F32A7|nr:MULTISPECIES: hypothetical protein [unclassified Streptomyces]MCX4460407.1 hypothetical protein [Streptomyces sp. NBC_01719]MCX4500263.1 hypothetical protein [Streptomyces sp. NBC_01728]MCX4597991.1 hypothetical protein [Streptomyces sp. NBC_01549]WSI45329.1 hypothetical protein OG585_51800 [Streptomyces sp. NBC_01340]